MEKTNNNNQIDKPKPYNKIDDTSIKWSNNYKKIKYLSINKII